MVTCFDNQTCNMHLDMDRCFHVPAMSYPVSNQCLDNSPASYSCSSIKTNSLSAFQYNLRHHSSYVSDVRNDVDLINTVAIKFAYRIYLIGFQESLAIE
jgi:hypothetical protein